jgi:tetratricopeptide (TPR) repeat protein
LKRGRVWIILFSSQNHFIFWNIFVMKKVIVLSALLGFVVFAFASCVSSNSSANASNQNLNSSANNQSAVVANSNAALTNSLANSPASPAAVENYTDANAALDAGKKFFAENEFENSVAALEQAVKLDANLAEAHFQLALAYENLEKETEAQKSYKDAIKLYQKHLAKNPKDAVANYNVGLAYNKINDDLKAEKALRQAAKLTPEDSEYGFELGQVLIKLAKYDEAIPVLKKALEIDPENLRIESALDRAQAGKKRVDAAKPKDKPQEKIPGKPLEKLKDKPKPPADAAAPTPAAAKEPEPNK